MGCVPSTKSEVEPAEQNGPQLLLKADKAQRLEAAKKRQEKLNEQHKKATLAAAGISKTAMEEKERMSMISKSSRVSQTPRKDSSSSSNGTDAYNHNSVGNNQAVKLPDPIHKGYESSNDKRPSNSAEGEPFSEKFEEGTTRALSGVSEEKLGTKESQETTPTHPTTAFPSSSPAQGPRQVVDGAPGTNTDEMPLTKPEGTGEKTGEESGETVAPNFETSNSRESPQTENTAVAT